VHALRNITGEEPEIVQAKCDIVHGVDETTRATLAFAGGLRAGIGTSMKGPFQATLKLRGERGSLAIVNYIHPQIGCRFTVEIGGASREEPTEGPSTYDAQLAHMGDVLLRGADPICGGEDAIANMAAIEAIYAKAGHVRS